MRSLLPTHGCEQGDTLTGSFTWKVGLLASMVCLVAVFSQLATAKEKVPKTKSIRGHVADSKKKSIIGAKIFIRNVKKKTTTVLITDESGLYAVYGLDPKEDYEVHAEHGGFVSEKKSVSSFLNRFDNVFNFELGTGKNGLSSASAEAGTKVELTTADQVKLAAGWFLPIAQKDAKLPAVLLIHGFGQDRRVWQSFVKEHLLPAGFAALCLDLRGHGESLEKAGVKINAEESWRSDPQQFPRDIAAAVQWLKGRDEVDASRIAVIGCDIGADLAFLASGRYEEVRAAAALSASTGNAKRLAAGVENFQPHSILYIATQRDSEAVESARQLEKLTGFPVRVQIFENSGARGTQILQEIPEASPLLIDWLKKM